MLYAAFYRCQILNIFKKKAEIIYKVLIILLAQLLYATAVYWICNHQFFGIYASWVIYIWILCLCFWLVTFWIKTLVSSLIIYSYAYAWVFVKAEWCVYMLLLLLNGPRTWWYLFLNAVVFMLVNLM